MAIRSAETGALLPARPSQGSPVLLQAQQEATARPSAGIPSFWGPRNAMTETTSLPMDARQIAPFKLATTALERPRSAPPSAEIP